MRGLAPAAMLLFLALRATSQISQRAVALPSPAVPSAAQGAYYALVIAINNYHDQPQLKTPVNDAVAIDRLLRERYGFQTRLMLDAQATRVNIIDALTQYRSTLHEDDSLLIYYAGHGIRQGDKSYWVPVDAGQANWIISDEITTDTMLIPARHILIISDSCYSGGLSREANAATPNDGAIAKIMAVKSRTLMASGRDEPVADGGREGHSVFAYSLINGLEKMEQSVFTGQTLYGALKEAVVGGSDQIPQYNMIPHSGHEGGDFIFARSGSLAGPSAPAQKQAATAVPTRTVLPDRIAAGDSVSMVGCWAWSTNIILRMQPGGGVTGIPLELHWQAQSGNQFTLTWPRFEDTLTMTPDGSSLTGANNYGMPIIAHRTSSSPGGTQGMAGTWQWGAAAAVVSENGTIGVGTLSGRWSAAGNRLFKITWGDIPIDRIQLSQDGQQLSAENQFGVRSSAKRIACPN